MTHHPWSTTCLLSEDARLTHNSAYYGWSGTQTNCCDQLDRVVTEIEP